MASTILSDNGVTSGSAGLKTTADSTGALALQTSTSGGTATTALTIDTSQNVGIGSTSPANKLQVAASFSGTSDIQTISRFDRVSSGTAANGLGGRLEFSSQDNAGSQRTAAFLNWGLASVASGSPTGFLSLSTRGTDPALYINNSGQVLIGTTSGTGTMQITGASGSRALTLNAPTNGPSLTFEAGSTAFADLGSSTAIFGTGSATDFVLGTRSGYPMIFGTSNTERMRIDSSGNATFKQAILLSYSENNNYATDGALSNYASGNGVYLNGNAAGWLRLNGDGSNASYIQITGASYSTSNQIQFFAAGSQRAAIDSSGNLCVATTQASNMSGGVGLRGVNGSANRNTGVVVSWGASSSGLPQYVGNWPTSAYWGIGYDSGSGGLRLGICSSDSNGWYWTGYAPVYGGAYTNASDYRLKENVIDYNVNALSKIMALRPVMYNIIPVQDDEYEPVIKTEIGFLAHEFQAQVPELVSGEKDGAEADGSPRMQGIDYAKFTAVLTKAIQEQQALITAQAETINALTARIVALEQA
jgi:hypothetical protein